MKTITVQEDTWEKLTDLKYSLKKKNLDEVIREILNRDHQGKKK